MTDGSDEYECAVCGAEVDRDLRSAPRGPLRGRVCSVECAEGQSDEMYKLRFRDAEGQKTIDIYQGVKSG